MPSPGDLFSPGIKPRSPTLQADSVPAESQGKPKNTGVGSLSLLQGVFLTQEPNRSLLHCRQICNCLPFPPVAIGHLLTWVAHLLESYCLFICTSGSHSKNTGVGCHALLQGIFLTQGLNPCLLHCKQILYGEPPGKPHIHVYIHAICRK